MHGGKSPRGPVSASFRHGRYSNYLPERYRAAFFAALQDPSTDDLRPSMALLEARETELLGRLSTEESGAAWRQARSALSRLRAANAAGDASGMLSALGDLERVVGVGLADEKVWREVLDTMEQRRKLVDTQRRRVESAGAYMTMPEVMALMGQVVRVVLENVEERDARLAISEQVRRVLLPAGTTTDDVIDVEEVG